MKKKMIFTLILLIVSVNIFGVTKGKEAAKKAKELIKEKKYSEALPLFNIGIKEAKNKKNVKKHAGLLQQKFKVLIKMGNYKEAIPIMDKLDILLKGKGYWHCFDAMNLYLKLKNKDKAFEWLEKIADRGFPGYDFKGEEFKLLHGDIRLKKIINKIKSNIGIGKMAKDFTVTLMTGKKLTLSKLKGKVIMLDFWNTKCPPCIKEMPFLKKMYKELNSKGFEIIGISFDYKKKSLETFLSKAKLPWKQVFSAEGWQDRIGKLYGVSFNPSTFIIDKNGILRHFGLHGEELKKIVLELL